MIRFLFSLSILLSLVVINIIYHMPYLLYLFAKESLSSRSPSPLYLIIILL